MRKDGTAYIHTGVPELKISHIKFYQYAQEFLNTAKSFNSDAPYSPVPYFLYCRSIELVIKAFLRTENVPISYLINKYGHNLIKLLNKAKKLGLGGYVSITKNIEKEVIKANRYYYKKEFEYFNLLRAFKGYSDLPNLAILADFTQELVTKLEEVVNKAT